MSLSDINFSNEPAPGLRVAHVGSYKPESTNGVNKMIAGLAESLVRLGVRVQIWNFTEKTNSIKERYIDGISIFELPCYRTRLQNLIKLPGETLEFIQILAKKIDLIHLHSVFKPENIWASRLGVPYIITPHNGYNPKVIKGRNRYFKKLWLDFFERPYVDRSSLMHAVSVPELYNLKDFASNTASVFLPNGVDSCMIEEDVPKPSDCTPFLYIGRLAVETKGLDRLVKGYALLVNRMGGRVPQLIIAGPDFRGGRKQLEQMVKDLNLTGIVKFEGPVIGQQKLDIFAKARAFIHTSRWEGMPTAVLEALALARPVLVTQETNMGGYVKDHGAGWVSCGTPQDIADKLEQIMLTPGHELDYIGQNGRCLVGEKFIWPAIVKELTAIYQGVVR